MKQISKIFKTMDFTKEEAEQNQMILEMVYDLAMNEIIEKRTRMGRRGGTF